LTDECNFDCAYCYQRKQKQRLEFSALTKAIDFFQPFFSAGCIISFYGGEPLLAFEDLKRTVEYVDELPKDNNHKIRYSLTTNGSLLNKDILDFLDAHRFSLMLSFDGLAQDVSRKKGSFGLLTRLIPKILARPRILLETNSVFSSETIGSLLDSVRYVIQLGVRKLNVNFAHRPPWTSSTLIRLEEEITRVREYFECRYQRWQDVPWAGFYDEPERGVFHCSAGQNQMAISAQGILWGCALFPHYFMDKSRTNEYKKYCFGPIDSFTKHPDEIYAQKMANYTKLRVDCYSTPDRSCLMCREVEYCRPCPIAAALTTGEIGRIPGWTCKVAKIMRNEKRLLWNRFKQKGRRTPKTSAN
jgi:sulfatase maturation enzyme AslB (radical SAM superfamily)